MVKIGDVVVLKSGSQHLTVSYIWKDNTRFNVQWFIDGNYICTEDLTENSNKYRY